jgi:hypothetical protein
MDRYSLSEQKGNQAMRNKTPEPITDDNLTEVIREP